MITAIIFDAEGVVIDSEAVWDHGQAEFLRRRGVAYDRESLKSVLTGRSLVDGVRVMQERYGFPGDPDALAEERKAIVRDLFATAVSWVDGFEGFYARIRGCYRTALATCLDPDLLAVVERRLHLSALFRGRVFSLADVGFVAKPDPALFLYAARVLQTPAAQCLVIEDAPLGVEAAKRAGMRCVALTTTYDRSRLLQADVVIAQYAQLDIHLL
ncbi:MAG: HAD family phosphatase [Thermodesulfobacteriota bacterium]|jgi:beta-phosphoglucomutase-like phosphatase (HAD superfamily)